MCPYTCCERVSHGVHWSGLSRHGPEFSSLDKLAGMGDFIQGTNWRAKNTHSIKLDTRGKKLPVDTRRTAPASPEDYARIEAARAAERAAARTAEADKRARAERARRARAADIRHAEKDHTPPGFNAHRVPGPKTAKQAKIARAIDSASRRRERAIREFENSQQEAAGTTFRRAAGAPTGKPSKKTKRPTSQRAATPSIDELAAHLKRLNKNAGN